tara:strand:+ start:82 stop:390 length:309 start_codon:yes stop_codon:yes gene_type:complete
VLGFFFFGPKKVNVNTAGEKNCSRKIFPHTYCYIFVTCGNQLSTLSRVVIVGFVYLLVNIFSTDRKPEPPNLLLHYGILSPGNYKYFPVKHSPPSVSILVTQ